MINNNADSENFRLHGFVMSIYKMLATENGRNAKNKDFHNYTANCHTFTIFTSK